MCAQSTEVAPPVNIRTRNHNFTCSSRPPSEAWRGSGVAETGVNEGVSVVPLLHQIFQIHQALSTVSNLCLHLGYYYGIVY